MGPIDYVLKERGGPVAILQNFGGSMVKVLVVNHATAAGVAVEIKMTTKAGAPALVPDYLNIPHQSSAFFAIGSDVNVVHAVNLGHNEGSARISVTYE